MNMTLTTNFLNIDLTTSNDMLVNTFISSIYEIRSEELGVTIDFLENHGDKEAIDLIKKSSIQDICIHTDTVKLIDDVPEHAKKIIDHYNKSDSVTVFRGTRLPLSDSSFKNGYIHTTPQFATSAAYAVGISNGNGGIGRLLTTNGETTGLGFIHSYEAPLTTKIYKNFQFETMLNNNGEDTKITLNDLKKELETFLNLEKSSFTVEYFSENNLYGNGNPNQKPDMSQNMQKWYDFITSTKCLDTPYYEVMLPDNMTPKFTFLINKNSEIIKLNLNNPKIKKVLQKLQSLLIRDFYEVKPLENLVNEIDFNISNLQVKKNNSSDQLQNKLFNLIKNESTLLIELKQSVLDMIIKIKKNTVISENDFQPLMNKSKMVGATDMIGEPILGSYIIYPTLIENFINEINTKKKLILMPLELFKKSEKIVLNSNSNNSSINLLDQLLNKIKEKVIPNTLKITEIDSGSVMLDLMNNIEKKLNIEHNNNPTIEDFINNLTKIKNIDLFREHCGKKLLLDAYRPFLEFTLYQRINTFNNKNIISDTIIKLRNKCLNNSENKDTIMCHNFS